MPSETLQLRRPYRNDRLAEFPPHRKKALVGVRSVKGHDFLVAKLSSRKNLTCGVIMKRPCFCGLNTDTARLVCPVHPLWPAIQARVSTGRILFSSVNRRNFNRKLNSILARLDAPQASRYSSHAFRRGSAQEMNETGSPLSVIASAGMWRSNALVKNYIDLAANVATNVKQLFRVDFNSESDMGGTASLWVQGENPLHRPARPPFPLVSGILMFWSVMPSV